MKKIKLGRLEVDLGELTDFIVEAKKNGYAAGGEKRRWSDGSKTFTFHKGNFHYRDNYAGSYQAPGNEIVRWQKPDGQRIWQMSYSGGILPKFWGNSEIKDKTLGFLKEVLLKVSHAHPFRGPGRYRDKGLIYILTIDGDIRKFRGHECILNEDSDDVIFSQHLIGCLVVP